MLKWEKSTSTKILFENSIDIALVTFWFPEEEIKGMVEKDIGKEFPEKVTEKPKVAENPEKGTEKVTKNSEKGTVKITENQQKMLKSMAKNQYVTRDELVRIVGISLSKIKENISKLKSKGLIERVGPDKGGYWKIKDSKK
jgi:ATP-dependent DNA helicase RecG